jgi:hypothetical protein
LQLFLDAAEPTGGPCTDAQPLHRSDRPGQSLLYALSSSDPLTSTRQLLANRVDAQLANRNGAAVKKSSRKRHHWSSLPKSKNFLKLSIMSNYIKH